MVRPRKHRLGDLQLEILKVLWDRGPASVGDVLAGLTGARRLAYTTVATMLRKMEARGLVTHREDGRRFLYSAAIREESVSTSMADDVLERIFEGSLADMVSHLLRTREVSVEELDALERLIAASRAESRAEGRTEGRRRR